MQCVRFSWSLEAQFKRLSQAVCTQNILKEFEFPEEDILSSREAANLT